MIEVPPYEIRLSTIDDIHFIINSWTLSMKHIYPHQYELDFNIHYNNYLTKLISNSACLIAHPIGDSNEILSYLVYSSFKQNLVAHFAYTKVDARNQGLLRSLLRFANPYGTFATIFTHPTKNEHIMDHFSKKWIFDPSIINLMEIK